MLVTAEVFVVETCNLQMLHIINSVKDVYSLFYGQ